MNEELGLKNNLEGGMREMKIEEIGKGLYKVFSKDNIHYVIEQKKGFICTCKGYLYAKNCKHIKEVKRLKDDENKKENDYKTIITHINCPYCNSSNVVVYEIKRKNRKDIKTYECVSCKSKFKLEDIKNNHPVMEIINLWIEGNMPYERIIEELDLKMNEDEIEKHIDDYLRNNLKYMPKEKRNILIRRLVLKIRNTMKLTDIAKYIKENYDCVILLRTIIEWIKERNTLEKYYDIINAMLNNGFKMNDVLSWLEGKGINACKEYLEDDMKLMKYVKGGEI